MIHIPCCWSLYEQRCFLSNFGRRFMDSVEEGPTTDLNGRKMTTQWRNRTEHWICVRLPARITVYELNTVVYQSGYPLASTTISCLVSSHTHVFHTEDIFQYITVLRVIRSGWTTISGRKIYFTREDIHCWIYRISLGVVRWIVWGLSSMQ